MGYIKNDFIIVIENHKSKRKHYRTMCDSCGIDRGYLRKNRAERQNCRSCTSKKTHTGKLVSGATKLRQSTNSWIANNPDKHPMLNKSHSSETKYKLSKKQREFCAENGNQFAGRSHSKETRERLSAINSGSLPKWKGRIFEYLGPKGRILMRSSYELA